jgi:hypothetical protein
MACSLCTLIACTDHDPSVRREIRDPVHDAGLHVGDPCTSDRGWVSDGGAFPPIGVGTCGLWADAPDGYYTARCEINGDCPDQARCGLGSHWCVARCRSDADCRAPASCHLSAAAAVSYCQVTGGVLGQGDRDTGASDACEIPCGRFETCCGNECYDLANDSQHCGRCDHACGADAPYCEDGQCTQPRCDGGCAERETCCAIYGASGPVPTCSALYENQSCPSGCHDCAQ